MARRLVSRSELARLAGVSPAAVTKQCRKALAPACVDDRIDLDHSLVAAWLKAKGVDPRPRLARAPAKSRSAAARTDGAPPRSAKNASRPAPAPTKRPIGKAPKEPDQELIDDLGAYLAMTLGDILERHGTERRWKDLLEARAKIAAIQERELGMSESRGELISRELVRQHVIGAIDAGNRRLLADATKTLARRLYAAARAGEPIEAGEKIAAEVIGSHLELAKLQAAKAVRGA